MNLDALVATFLFAGALLSVFGVLYRMAVRSHASGELSYEGIRLLRWGLAGQLAIFVVLGITAFLT
ncbi:MAG: hypothetical protein JRN06_12545 [Nitrososphaerota archaeon]|nr:hypothetical protein [Nitrososphaerota archaeon]